VKHETKLACSLVLVVLSCILSSCKPETAQVHYKTWTVSKPILQAGDKNAFDNVAVKDASIVYYNGKYHLFYTSKRAEHTDNGVKYQIGTGYVCAETLEGLAAAQRYELTEILDADIIAPQIFYFRPQEQWYLIAQRRNQGKKPNLMPIYMTNTDINNVYGWSKPKDLETAKSNDRFWIDFWVICDDDKAHLFYSDQKGSVLRMECPVGEFPQGLAKAKEEVALTAKGQDKNGKWIMFEAEHVFHVKRPDKYLILLEGGYFEQAKNHYGDARNRFVLAMVADKLEGPWTRIEDNNDEYFGFAGNLFNEDGSKSKYTQVSHPELIRSGYDQRLEIEDFNIQMVFQSFDGSHVPNGYDYNELPWELAVMRNY